MDTVFKEIMIGYERQLAEDKRAQRKRIQEVHGSVPGYKELEDLTADLSAKAAIMAASGRKDEAAPILHELVRLSDEKRKALTDAGIPDGYLSIRYECPDCRDTGYINGRKCHCLMKKIVEYYYINSGLYEKLRTENFDTFSFDYFEGEERDNIREIYDASRSFVETFADSYRNMLFYGSVGCGKSFMSNCIARELMDRGVAVTYVSAVRLFDILSAHIFGKQRAGAAEYEMLFNCPLLIIDDLGTEIGSSAVSSELFAVLNERDLKSLSTIISTNYSMAELKDKYSDRAFSRLLGNYEIYRFSGDDIRLKKAEVS
ncbi:MAG: ATP-binding protein [Lachnospiraceae bacterium]|nr:ATP-binding protein [Lachnospiraceae bacterium]